MTEYPHALSPWELNGRTFRNRIFVAAHATNYQIHGTPSQRYADYLAARARGGAAMIVAEGAHVHPSSGHHQGIDLWRPEAQTGLLRLTDAVHNEGALIFAQIMHAGRQQEPLSAGRPVMAPSAVIDPVHYGHPHALTKAEIREIIDYFVLSAKAAVRTGFDGLEIHCSNGYLLQQFLSPWSNERTDEYGGSTDNRMRFARDTIRAILDAVGSEVVVGARFNAFEQIAGGLTREDSRDICGELAREGLQFISVSSGNHTTPELTVPPAGTPVRSLADEARLIRDSVDCAVFASHRIKTIDDAEAVLASGAAEMVSMARAHIADPEVVKKASEGRSHETRLCIGCVQGCRGQLQAAVPIGCLVNPEVGHESTYVEISVTGRPTVAVVGGGIAGMQYALTSARRGKDVTLFEAAPVLGGTFRRSAALPGRAELADFTDWLEAEITRAGVAIKTGTTATASDLQDFDEVTLATGATYPEPADLSRVGSAIPVIGLHEALADSTARSGHVVIVDHGDHHNIALLLAQRYLEGGASGVDVLDTKGAVAAKLDLVNKVWLKRSMDAGKYRTASNVNDVTVTGDAVSFQHEGWSVNIENVAMVVEISVPVAADQLASELADHPNLSLVGDCAAPGHAVEVVHHAYVSALGREAAVLAGSSL